MNETELFENKLKLTLAMDSVKEYINSLSESEVNSLALLDKLRRLKKPCPARKTDYWEEGQKISSVERKKFLMSLFVNTLKSKIGCYNCEENHIACLEFHHIEADDKLFSIASATWQSRKLDEVVFEIKKCVLICSNCHKKEHYGSA